MMPVAVVVQWQSTQWIPLVLPLFLLWPLLYPVWGCLWVAKFFTNSESSRIKVGYVTLLALMQVRGLRVRVQDATSFFRIDCY